MSASARFMKLFTRLSVGWSMARAWVLEEVHWIIMMCGVLMSSHITWMVRVLLTVVSRTLITQTVFRDASLMCFVRVAVDRPAAMSSTTVASMAMRLMHTSRIMPRVSIDIILHDAILVHSQAVTLKSILVIIVIIFVTILVISRHHLIGISVCHWLLIRMLLGNCVRV